MSYRVLIPKDVQSLIEEIRPYLSDEMKEIDVIRTVLVDFKLNRNLSKLDENGFNTTTKKRLLKAKEELEDDKASNFKNFDDVIEYAKNNSK